MKSNKVGPVLGPGYMAAKLRLLACTGKAPVATTLTTAFLLEQMAGGAN